MHAREDAARPMTEPWGSGLLLGVFCLTLLAAPVPLAGNRPWAWTALAGVLFLLVLTWGLFSIRRKSPVYRATERAVFMAMVLWITYTALYLVPVPPQAVQILSAQVHDAYRDVYALFTLPNGPYYLTIDWHATLEAFLKYATYAAGFFLVTVLVTSRTRLKLSLYTVLAAGVLQVGLALAARAMNVELTPRELMDGHWDVLRGTFVNRNHFAEFLAMTAAAGIGLALSQTTDARPGRTLTSRISGIMDRFEGPVIVTGGAVLVVGMGMIMSTSRGGIAALCVGIAAALLLSVLARGWRAREMILVWPLGAAVIGAFAWTGSRDLLERFMGSGLVISERWTQWDGTMGLIRDNWLMGTGPGTYQYAFTEYKDASLRPLLYDHAHNDYLQLLAEHGIVGAVLLSVVVLALFHQLLRSFIKRRDMLVRGALFASLAGMLAMLVHSLVEFNFQIPANALYFWVLAGIGVAATRLESQSGHRPRSRVRTRRRVAER